MKRLFVSSLRSCSKRPFSFSCTRLAAPAPKYLEIYNADFETQTYPIQLLGGTHISFAKILFKFAEQAENKDFDMYLKDFEVLAQIAAKVGPFWTEQEVMSDSTFDGLSQGFRFTLGWMQSERMLDSTQLVKASYQELVDAATQRVRATITVPWDPSSNSSKVEEIKVEAKELYAKRNPGSSPSVVFQLQVNPALNDGYTFEIDNIFVNRSAAAMAASASAGAKDQIKDWTAMPALPIKAVHKGNALLSKLIGAEMDQLAEIDDVERRHGV